MPRLHFIADDFLNQEDLCTEMLVGKTVAGGDRIIISREHLEDRYMAHFSFACLWLMVCFQILWRAKGLPCPLSDSLSMFKV